MRGGVGNLGEMTDEIGAKGYDGSVSARIEDVDRAVAFCNRNWEGAASGLLIDEDGQTADEMEAGDGAAGCVDSEQQVVVTAESERTLRLQWISGTSASAAARGKAPFQSETSILATLIGEHLVLDRVVCHDEDGGSGTSKDIGGVHGGGECSDAERDGQQAANYFQHCYSLDGRVFARKKDPNAVCEGSAEARSALCTDIGEAKRRKVTALCMNAEKVNGVVFLVYRFARQAQVAGEHTPTRQGVSNRPGNIGFT